MERIELGGRLLAFEDRGSGEPVVLLHSGFIADSMRPLAEDERLGDGRRLIVYHRRGYGGSGRAEAPISVAEQAGDALALMDALGVDAADLVGHSFGATVALELALTVPERVRSLVVMEPLLTFALSPESARYVTDTAAVAFPRFERGDAAGAVDAWLTGAFGEGYREILDAALPGWFDQAARDAGAAFGVEVPSLQSWPRGPDDFGRIAAPALSVVNAGAAWPGFRETHEALLAWLPQAEGVTVPARSHLLQLEDARPVAEAIGGFLDRRLATRV